MWCKAPDHALVGARRPAVLGAVEASSMPYMGLFPRFRGVFSGCRIGYATGAFLGPKLGERDKCEVTTP